jgi:hypothetical protein
MTIYKLPCKSGDCDATLNVDASQAGLMVPCPRCNTLQEVPTIRGLSRLERVTTGGTAERRSKWGPPQSIMTAGAVIFLVFVASGLMLLSISPPHPHDDFEPPAPLAKDTPAIVLFQEWQKVHQGLSAPSFGETVDYERAKVARRNWAIACFVMAGLGLVVAGTGWSMKRT